MLRVSGKIVGTGVREGEEKMDRDTGRTYRTNDRYVVAVASGHIGQLPDYYTCESKAVMENIARETSYDQAVELLAKPGPYGRMLVTGLVVSAARVS